VVIAAATLGDEGPVIGRQEGTLQSEFRSYRDAVVRVHSELAFVILLYNFIAALFSENTIYSELGIEWK
jgi:hypothetical protein